MEPPDGLFVQLVLYYCRTGFLRRYVNFLPLQFCAIHTTPADSTDGKVTNRALLPIESEKVHRLYPPLKSTHPHVTPPPPLPTHTYTATGRPGGVIFFSYQCSGHGPFSTA